MTTHVEFRQELLTSLAETQADAARKHALSHNAVERGEFTAQITMLAFIAKWVADQQVTCCHADAPQPTPAPAAPTPNPVVPNPTPTEKDIQDFLNAEPTA